MMLIMLNTLYKKNSCSKEKIHPLTTENQKQHTNFCQLNYLDCLCTCTRARIIQKKK